MATITRQPQRPETTHLDLDLTDQPLRPSLRLRTRLIRLCWMDSAERTEYRSEYRLIPEDRLPKASKA